VEVYQDYRPQLHTFWAELSPCEHLVQIYESDETFLGTLADFIGTGLFEGQACAVIATPVHRHDLDGRLKAMGIDVSLMKSQDRLISLDAEETLKAFMVNDWPDEQLFRKVVGDLIKRGRRTSPKVRVFGEMVAVMWAKGHCGATVQLEHIWSAVRREEEFSLFCAYPKAGLTEKNASASMATICAAHSKVLTA
jgi:hypothetical protein